MTLGGRSLTCLRIQESPQDHAMLPIGTDVRIDWSLGLPYIDGVLPSEGDVPDSTQNPVDNPTGTEGFGVNDPVLDRNYGANGRAPGAPTDVLPGDFVRRSPDGATVAAMSGKTALLHGGHLAQLLLFGNEDKAELIAGIFRLITWMGESKITNEGGRTSFIWRGGANQLSETGSDEERYTIHLDVGATGNLVNFRITTIDQQTLFQAHITGEGHVEIFGIAGLDSTFTNRSGSGHVQRFDGDVSRTFQGAVTETVTGNRSTTVESDATEEFSNNLSQRVGNDWNVRANRNAELSAGGGMSRRVVGDDNKQVGGKELKTIQGDAEDTIRGHKHSYADGVNEVKSVNDKVMVTCQNGNFECDAGGNLARFTCQAMEVAGNTNNAVLYNELNQILSEFISNYVGHTHQVSTAGSATAQTGLASPPIDSTSGLSARLPQMQSQKLKLGG
jgi:hypothetical protein